MCPHGAPATDKPVSSWNLDVRAGQVYTTAAIGSNKALKTIVLHDDPTAPAAPGGGITLRSVLDAAGAPVAPVGAVPAGGGGSLDARFVLPSGAWLWAIVCCSLLGGGLGVANARRGRA
jgi:hypothetical protein